MNKAIFDILISVFKTSMIKTYNLLASFFGGGVVVLIFLIQFH